MTDLNMDKLKEMIKNCKTKNKGSEYRCRKKLSIQKTRDYLEYNQPDWLDFFDSTKKKDDLGDTYLQGKYFLENYN